VSKTSCANKVLFGLVLMQALVCRADQVEIKNLSLEDSMIEQMKGDIDALYEEWIKARWQIVYGKKERGFFTLDNGVAASKDIDSGMRRFCSSVNGNFTSETEKWGWIFTCSDKSKQLIGKLSIQTYKNPERIKIFLDSPKAQANAKAIYEKRAQALEASLLENGPTGWVTINGDRRPFLRIGNFKERWPCYVRLSSDDEIAFEAVKKISITGVTAHIETADGLVDSVNTARLNRRKRDSYYGHMSWGISGIKSLSLILMADNGTLYEQVIDNLNGLESIEIDQNAKPLKIAATGDFPDEVIEFGRKKLSPILEEKRLRALEEQRIREQRAAKEEARLIAWRKTLSIGSDTFCGPVIELRSPMVKIAVNAQLAGFGSEAWLKAPQVFPPEYGCLNTNGRLAPRQTP